MYFQNPVLLKDFIATNIFDTAKPTDSKSIIPVLLQTALTSLCEWPNRVKRIVHSINPDSPSGPYMVKVNHNGHWQPIVLDDMVPVADLEQKRPFVLKPKTHFDSLCIQHDKDTLKNSPKKCRKMESQIVAQEVWPQIVTKALAKSLLNYERLLQQNLDQYLRMLTGMPVKEYPVIKVDYPLLRLSFKREHIVIAQANYRFLSLVNKLCDTNQVEQKELLNYWNVGQVVEIDKEGAETDQPEEDLDDQSPEEDIAVEKSPIKKPKKEKTGKQNTLMWVELTNPYCKVKNVKGTILLST